VAVTTLEQAAAWVNRVGVALVFPKDDLVLPSLWQAAGGADEFAERTPEGEFVRWTAPMQFVWTTKDELPARGLACAGKHVRGRAALLALDVLPALAALAPRADELAEIDRDVVELLRETGPLSTRELPDLLRARERRPVRAALDRLQRLLVVTNAGLEQTDGWPAIVVDLVERRYATLLGELPPEEEARRVLARRVLDSAKELSAADLGAIFGWRKRVAAEVLDSLAVEKRDEDGVEVWLSPRG
jgi:DNA glycosylase AlkZ-like